MKVCTDACILGAWTAQRLGKAGHILDIGTGTGLLSLMLAQESNARFDAIELDSDSFEQAKINIQGSNWSDRIRIFLADVRSFQLPESYDFIITNPPFYEHDLISPVKSINSARHGFSLTLDELIRVIKKNLRSEGAFSILLPARRFGYFQKLAFEYGYHLKERVLLCPSPQHDPFRTIGLFDHVPGEPILHEKFIIALKDGTHTENMKALMEKYYL